MAKKYKWICDYCGEEYDILSYQLNRLKSGKQKSAFCSIECKSKSQQRRLTVNCAYCGAEISKTEFQATKSVNSFCSQKCKSQYLYESTRENRICEVCGKEYETMKVSKQRFCSPDCANEYQKTRVGKLNAKYRRVEMPCDWCGCPIEVKQSKISQEHHFCCQDCRQEWYAKDFSQRDEFRDILRIKILERMNQGLSPTLNSKPQQIVDEILDGLNVKYEREYPLDYYSIDNYLTDCNLIIEVQGDYYHASPLKYQEPTGRQITQVGRDKARHSFILNKYGIEILYIWEHDAYKNPDVCKELIRLYIENKGILINYNSFNYHLEDGRLKINNEIITPFHERNNIKYSRILNDCGMPMAT